MCSPAGCTFCSLISGFGAFFMFFLGICISNNYEFVGEWFTPEEGRGSPTEEQIKTASTNCFITGGIYVAFTVLAAVSVCYLNRKAKRT